MQVFLKLGKQIPETSRKEDVLKMFQILSGNFRMDEAKQILADVPNEMEMSHCLNLKRRAEWWCIENHLRMFTIAFSKTTEEAWQSTPKPTNLVQSLNLKSIHQRGL